MIKVKICGITSYEDAAMCVDNGVDAIGFNFYNKSPRYIAPSDAREIALKLPPFTSIVGLFVNELNLEYLTSIADMVGISVVQLHGNESPEYCSHLLPRRVIKALRVGETFDVAHVKDFSVSAILLDNYSADAYGGTGQLFDWRIAIEAKQYTPRIIVAGGIVPENVVAAIRAVKPYGVDVCSGVESAPGRKDRVRLQTLMQEVRRGFQELQKSTTGHLPRFSLES